MNIRSMFRVLSCLCFAICLIPRLYASPAFGEPSAAAHSSIPLDRFVPVLSDFDGDNQLDRATLSSSGHLKTIHIALSRSSWRALSFDSDVLDRGVLISGDIDDDGDIDLVWMSPTAGKYLHWLGDGRGNFAAGSDTRIVFDHIHSLLENSEREHVEQGIESICTAILPCTTFILSEHSGFHLLLLSQNHFLLTGEPVPTWRSGENLRPRGPPSNLC